MKVYIRLFTVNNDSKCIYMSVMYLCIYVLSVFIQIHELIGRVFV